MYKQKGISFRAYFACDFSISHIPQGTKIKHPVGIVISTDSRIGTNCTILQNVTIGKRNGVAPGIGNNVVIGAGAIIIGDISIGNNSKIGAGSIVIKNVPANSTYVNTISPQLLKKV